MPDPNSFSQQNVPSELLEKILDLPKGAPVSMNFDEMQKRAKALQDDLVELIEAKKSEAYKKILCVDFDGVLHSYSSGWQGADVIPDEPVPGALEWLAGIYFANAGYEVCVYSSRSKEPGGIEAMQDWFVMWGLHTNVREWLQYPTEKPAAWLTIDDRAVCFEGDWSELTIEAMDSFKPWNKS